MDERTTEMVAHVMNGLVMSIAMLTNCLKNSGALDDGRFEAALNSTINAEGAEKDRLDYQVMQQLLAVLEGRPPPKLRVIQGGKDEQDE